jgi:hypothetical protein
MNKRFTPIELLLLVALLAGVVFVMARGTLHLPYVSDDFEHAQLIGQIRAGLLPGWQLLTAPFHGQTDVMVRLLFWFGSLAGGMNLMWVRLGAWAVHVAGAVGCAILCARWTESKHAGFLAGLLYAGALGFASELIWWPSSAIFSFGVTFLIFALVALDPEASNAAWSVGLAVLMLVLAALGLNGILVAALDLPLYCWLMMPANRFWRRRVPLVLLATIAVLLALAYWQQSHQHDREQVTLHGVVLGFWLIATAPLRFFSGFTAFSLPGFRTLRMLAPLAWLPFLASIWWMPARYRRLLFAIWTPAILLALLIGMVRANYLFRFGPGSIYIADRYYYAFLFPLVTHTVLFIRSIRWPKYGVAALAIVTLAALTASHYHYLANIPRANVAIIDSALERGRRLVAIIRSSPVRPMVLADAAVPLDGAHLNTTMLAFLIYSEYPRGIPGVRLVAGPIDPPQSTIENAILNRWSAPPVACVVDGRLQPVRAGSRIDFQNGSYEENLTSGFSWPEGPFRWMRERASLHLTAAPGDLVVSAYAPVDQLHRPIHITVAINGNAIGGFAVSSPGLHDYHLQAPALAPGSQANITLASDTIWHSRDILPDSLDDRDLSIAIFAIGFGDPHQPYHPPPCRETLN